MNTELNPIEFKANQETGECFASQRVVAKMCGVEQSSVSRLCASNNFNVKQGLTFKAIGECLLHYTSKGKETAKHNYALYCSCDSISSLLKSCEKKPYIQRKKQSKRGFIYVIKCNEFYKIGKANNVEKRLKSLQTANPYTLDVIIVKKAKNSYTMETFFHNLFSDKRIHGEWFKLEDSDLSFISDYK